MHPLWSQVEVLQPRIWRAVCGYELNPALREELFQDVLLAVCKSLPRLAEPGRLLPFVLRIAHNLGASHVRSATRYPAPLPLDDEAEGVPDRSAHDPAAARSRWLFEALATLPVGLRQVLMLQLEGFEYQEIAAMLGISVQNVGVRVHRAKERLRAMSLEEGSSELR
ncbi:RNA polymerase sigma factor [Lysobacter korlensis]|uniref:RNA polymerase sigma factor n=1 Tax=Lysobacter korlensis TaxID=553636 RepID=A0ABV6RSS0_9GAMM